jgi:DNA repair exonuclease SbcCD ATPase subunit
MSKEFKKEYERRDYLESEILRVKESLHAINCKLENWDRGLIHAQEHYDDFRKDYDFHVKKLQQAENRYLDEIKKLELKHQKSAEKTIADAHPKQTKCEFCGRWVKDPEKHECKTKKEARLQREAEEEKLRLEEKHKELLRQQQIEAEMAERLREEEERIKKERKIRKAMEERMREAEAARIEARKLKLEEERRLKEEEAKRLEELAEEEIEEPVDTTEAEAIIEDHIEEPTDEDKRQIAADLKRVAAEIEEQLPKKEEAEKKANGNVICPICGEDFHPRGFSAHYISCSEKKKTSLKEELTRLENLNGQNGDE